MKFLEMSPDLSILNVFHPPFTVIVVLLLPLIWISRKFAKKIEKSLMYAFYIMFILPVAYCYFLICEGFVFVPCYIYGIVYLARIRFWQKLVVWIFAGPFILLFQSMRGSWSFFNTSLEFPEAHLI